MDNRWIQTSYTYAKDARQAVREFRAGLTEPRLALVVFFCSADYDLETLAGEMRRVFPHTQVVGCTTAGEIGPRGYHNHSLVGVGFPGSECAAVVGYLDHLQELTCGQSHEFVQDLLRELEARSPQANEKNTFAFQLIDGLSRREELVTHVLQTAFGGLPLLGGSAGGGPDFSPTYVYFDGAFHRDSAVVTLVSTSLPFMLFKTQHFVATDERLVVTKAKPDQRLVMEINGLPAVEEYARLVGVGVNDLDSKCFATAPLVILIDGTEYVRSIQQANPDGSLTFYCAIEEGLVLRVAKGQDLIGNLQEAFDRIHDRIGQPQLTLSFDCILRNREILQSDLQSQVEEIFNRNHAVGFNTYGEQYRGVHINQTLTGIAIGVPLENGDG